MPGVATPDNSEIIIVINDLNKPYSIARLIEGGKKDYFFRVKVVERTASSLKLRFIGLRDEEQISITLFGVNAIGVTLKKNVAHRVITDDGIETETLKVNLNGNRLEVTIAT